MTKRLKILKKIAKDAEITKTAQEAIDTANQLPSADSEEFAHKVFEALLNKIKSEILDD